MDIHMPVMSGLEATEKIIKLNTGIPIVAMTANIMSNDVEIYTMSGMHDYLGKPFTSQELWHCLMKYLQPVSRQPVNEAKYAQVEEEFQQRLINHFVNSNQNKFSEITGALNSGDIKLAHRLIHSLRGNAGQLEKTPLQNAAKNVEEQLKNGKNNAGPDQLAALERELNAVLAELTPLVYEPAKHEQLLFVDPLDTDERNELFGKLESLLKSGNPKSLALIDSLRRIPESAELIKRIEEFEFELALETFAELQGKVTP
jgi:CheY-like chemotaxis protein